MLSGAGRRKLIQTSFLAFFRHGRTIKKMQYVIQNFRMKKTGNIQPDKLLWRVISDGADRFSEPSIWRLLTWKAVLLITLPIM